MDRKWNICIVAVCMALNVNAWGLNEGTHLNPRGQAKVNKVLAKGYLQSGVDGMQKQQMQVNIGNKRAGTCTMNIGANAGNGKDSKEIIVTAKEIINVCK